jgi:hypothetical protein
VRLLQATAALEAEILILRHQLNVLQQRAPRRRLHLRWIDRAPRTHPARARSSGSETLLRSRSLVDYTIDMHESEFSGPQGVRQAK